MIIDLTKLIYSNLYKLPIKGEVIVPDEMLKNTDITSRTKMWTEDAE